MDIGLEKLDRLRRQRLLRQGAGRCNHHHSRPLILEDQVLPRASSFIVADMGNEGAMEYRNGRMEGYMTWNMPAALLMTVSFGFTFAISSDVVQSTPLGYVSGEVQIFSFQAHQHGLRHTSPFHHRSCRVVVQ